MKLRAIRTVHDMIQYLWTCNPDAKLLLMPEGGDSDGFPISGILAFEKQPDPEIWILIDEFGNSEEEDLGDEDDDVVWSRLPPEPGIERPGDMGQVEVVTKDVVKIRGKLRSA